MDNDESESYVTATDDSGRTVLRFKVDEDGVICMWEQVRKELTDIPMSIPMSGLNIYIPSGVRELGAFYSWYGRCIPSVVQNFYVAKENPVYASHDGALYSKDMTRLILYPSEKSGPAAIPEGVTAIAEKAFVGCSGIQSLHLPASMGYLPKENLSFLHNLESISVAEDSIFFSSVDGILYDKNLSQLLFLPPGKGGTVTISEGITEISAQAIFQRSRIEILNIPASLVGLNEGLLEGCWELREINISEGNCLYASKDGIVYSKDMSTLIYCPRGKYNELVVIPDGVTRLEAGSFGMTQLKRLVIPASVTAIDKGAIQGGFPIHVQEGNPVYESVNGQLTRKDGGQP